MPDRTEKSRYEIEGTLGKGGMGEVWSAKDQHFGRLVAMKVIREDLEVTTRETRARLVQEARILSQLEHPNIVPVYDLDKDAQGRVFYTMKQVEGETLREILSELKRGDSRTVAKYPLNTLLTVFQKVCDATAYAHAKGVVHRDLKPENIMLGSYGEVLVMDWGLAKVLEANAEEDGAHEVTPAPVPEGFQELDPPPGESGLTLEGQVMGTPQFMAPEQAEGRIGDIDARSDIFSLGGILYSILTLRAPTGGSSVREVLGNVKSGYIAPPIIYNRSRTRAEDGTEMETSVELLHCPAGQIPEALSAVAMKALAGDPAQRYQTVEELQKDIGAYQAGFATLAEEAGKVRRARLWVRRNKALSGAVVVVLVFIGAVMGRIISSERAARTALTELRGLLPTLETDLEGLVRAQEFEQALDRINYMLKLSPDNADYLNQKGNLLQSLLRFEESAKAYRQALAERQGLVSAEQNLKLSEKLVAELPPGKQPEPRHFLELEAAMNRQNRLAESVAMLKHVGKDRAALLKDYKAALKKAGWEKQADKLQMDEKGLLIMDARSAQLSDLSPLKGLPFVSLLLDNNQISDVSPLKDMPLTSLEISGNPLADLAPLRGLRLTKLNVQYTRIDDLRALESMPLRRLSIQNTKVADISPLKGMPLRELLMTWTRVKNIDALAGMPLDYLDCAGAGTLDSISPLQGMKLKWLRIDRVKDNDWSYLQGMPLKFFDGGGFSRIEFLRDSPLEVVNITSAVDLKDLSPLTSKKLRELTVNWTPIQDLRPLIGMRIKSLTLNGTKIDDLNPLKDLPLEKIVLTNNKELTDLTPISGLPVTHLYLQGCEKLKDVSPLAKCLELERIALPVSAQNLEALRNLPRLKQLAYGGPGTTWNGDWSKVPPAEEFWKAYDARKGSKR